MKVLQLIDSLQPGGAERMAVNLANELRERGFESYLCATREEGLLKDSIDSGVNYLFLKKKNSIDIAGMRRLYRFIKKNNIDVIHAHSSSFFWATVVKIFYPDVRLIWHDHYGNSENVGHRSYGILRCCSRYFNGIISVNEILKNWAEQHLRSKKVTFIRNFVSKRTYLSAQSTLMGEPGFRIICLANLRRQKDHFNLLAAFKLVQESIPGASLHLVGKHIDTEYAEELTEYVKTENLRQVYFLGAQEDVHHLLIQASVGVLSSRSEGLPVALLEYGINGLAVVCTDVGQCKEVIGVFGKIVPAGSPVELGNAIIAYLTDPVKLAADSALFHTHIKKNYSFQTILPELKEMYES
jgi:glycosyltransferase involved in cell wall biosynthesis